MTGEVRRIPGAVQGRRLTPPAGFGIYPPGTRVRIAVARWCPPGDVDLARPPPPEAVSGTGTVLAYRAVGPGGLPYLVAVDGLAPGPTGQRNRYTYGAAELTRLGDEGVA